MLSVRLVSRSRLPQYAANVQCLHSSSTGYSSTSSSSSSDDEKRPRKKDKVSAKPAETQEQKQKRMQEANERMTALLKSIGTKKTVVSKPVDLAIPPKMKKPKVKRYEDEMIEAAKNVAASLGGDVKKTEFQLLEKLTVSVDDPSKEKKKKKKLPPPPVGTLRELISDMKVDTTSPVQAQDNRSPLDKDQIHSKKWQEMGAKFSKLNLNIKSQQQKETLTKDHLYGNLMGILQPVNTEHKDNNVPLETWNLLEQRELKLAVTLPPTNAFKELIQWTEEGKLWKFPIDNEQGMEEEQNVHFSEHVFMERHLQGWCPKVGPIRHFMELVCVGLSKNPYMTVSEKRGHIEWYRDFFTSKEELLSELGVLEEGSQTKQIEGQ